MDHSDEDDSEFAFAHALLALKNPSNRKYNKVRPALSAKLLQYSKIGAGLS